MLDNNDDTLIAILKRQINKNDILFNEMENDYQQQINRLRTKFNEAQKENIELQKRVRELDSIQDKQQGISQEFTKKIKEYDRELRKRTEQLQKSENLRVGWQNKYNRLKQKMLSLLAKKKPGSGNQDPSNNSLNSSNSGRRPMLRKKKPLE